MAFPPVGSSVDSETLWTVQFVLTRVCVQCGKKDKQEQQSEAH